MSENAIKMLYSNTVVPAWAIPEIKKIAKKQSNEFGVNFDHIEYRDFGGETKYFRFEAIKQLKDHSFIIEGTANIKAI